MKIEDLRWFQCEIPKKWRGKAEQWMAMAALDRGGDLWLPAIASGRSETEIALCCSWDGTPIVLNPDNHVFVSGDWLVREFPECSAIVRKIKRRIVEVDGGH